MKKFVTLAAVLVLMTCSGAARAETPAAYTVKPDIVYGHKDGMALTFDVFEPNENAKGVGLMFMVSGGWVSAWTPPEKLAPRFLPLIDAGYTVIAVRHGSSPRYVIPEIAVDVRSALRFVSQKADELKIDPQRIGVFGFSAGGHLSLLLGTRPDKDQPNGQQKDVPHVAAVVAVFPPTDLGPFVDPASPLRERFPALKFDPAQAGDYSPLMQVSSDDAPTLLVHGDKDELVPIWHSEKIVAAFDEVKVPNKLVVISGAAHGFDAAGNKKMMDSMVEWFDKHLSRTER